MAFDENGYYPPDDSSYIGDSPSFDFSGLSDLFGNNDLTSTTDTGYNNPYFDLASELSQSGLSPTDSYGMPDLSALLGSQYSDAIDTGDLGNLGQYTPDTSNVPTALDQQALQDAALRGSGYDPVVGNSNVVLDPNTSELINISELADRQQGGVQGGTDSSLYHLLSGLSNQGQPQMSARNTKLNDFLAFSDYPHSSVNDAGEVVAAQGPYSSIYDPESQASFDSAANLVDYQAQPGTDLYDSRNMLQKGLSGALSLLRGNSASGTSGNSTTGARTATQNSLMGGSGGDLAKMLALAAGVFQKNGHAPSATNANPSASAWTVSRKAGSGRTKKAGGGSIPGQSTGRGALGLLAGKTPGQADVVPIDASHGEYVMDADIVSALGDGNTDAGAAKLDQMREAIRSHKRSAPSHKIPPKAKSPLQYMNGAK